MSEKPVLKKRSEAKAATVAEQVERAFEGVQEAAAATSVRLAAELKASAQTGLRPDLFEHDNRVPPAAAQLRPDVQRVVDRVFALPDADAEYTLLEYGLTVGEKRGDAGTVARAVDEAADMAHRAHRLYCSASIESTRYEIEAEVVQGALWGAASEALQAEKDAKVRNKAITDADVRMKAAAMFPDQWMDVHMQRARVKLMVENCERLADLWRARLSSTEALLRAVRK